MLDERLRDARVGVKTALVDAAPPPIDDLAWEPGRRMPPVVTRRGWLVAAASAAAVLLLIGLPILVVSLSNRGIDMSETTVPPSVPETVTTIPETVTTVPETAPTTIAPLPGGSPIAWIDPDWSRVGSADALGGDLYQSIAAVAAGGPGLVAVGRESSAPEEGDTWAAVVWVSEDGTEWSRVPHDEDVFGGPGGQDMLDVAPGGPGLVAVGVIDHAYFGGRRSSYEFRPSEYDATYGYESSFERDDIDAAVWTSVDGVVWKRVPDPDEVFSGPSDGSSPEAGDEGMEAVAVGNGLIVAVGSAHGDAAVWVSTDGSSWERIPHAEAVFGGQSSQLMHDVTFTGERFVAVGTDVNGAEVGTGLWRGAVWLSDDGYAWSRVPNDPTVFGGENEAEDIPSMQPFFIWAVTSTDSGLVAAGTSLTHMALWTSPDGAEWTRVFDETAPFAYPDVKRFPNTSQLKHAPVKALAGFEGGVLAVGWDRDAATMMTLNAQGYAFEPVLVPGQLYTTEAKTDVLVSDGRAVAVGHADGDAAIWIADVND